MPAITFPFDEERHVYLEDMTQVLVSRGTLMTVRPTILFEVKSIDGELAAYIPMGDGTGSLDRSSFSGLASKKEILKLEHFIHDSSAGPLAFTSVMPPDVFWDLAFRGSGATSDWRDDETASDLFVADVCFQADSGARRPILIHANGKYLQTAIVHEKELNVCLRIEQLFRLGRRDAEPCFFVQARGFRAEIIFGQFEEVKTLYFTCSVWDVLLRHHLSNWSEQPGGGIAFKRNARNFPTQSTTPVFFRKTTARA